MEITRVKIALSDDERIKAYATITIDDCLVIQGLRLTAAKKRVIFFLCREERGLTAHT
jgi:DNA-binding cell septation regulator SpoVG